MDAAHKLLEAGCDCTIIFLTSSREYALEGYEVGAFRYLLKPLTYDKLEDTLNPFLRKFRGEARKLPLMVERTPLYIPYSDLYYLSSVMRQTEVHLEKKVLKQSSAINFQKTIAPLLSDSRFFLCSKGVIVNLQHVSELEKDHFVLNNGEEAPISRRNLSQAKKTFLDFSLSQGKDIFYAQIENAYLFSNSWHSQFTFGECLFCVGIHTRQIDHYRNLRLGSCICSAHMSGWLRFF